MSGVLQTIFISDGIFWFYGPRLPRKILEAPLLAFLLKDMFRLLICTDRRTTDKYIFVTFSSLQTSLFGFYCKTREL